MEAFESREEVEMTQYPTVNGYMSAILKIHRDQTGMGANNIPKDQVRHSL